MRDDDEEHRIDFSAIDPSRDSARWENLIARTTAAAISSKRAEVFTSISKWAWPLVTMAALVMCGAFAITLRTESSSSISTDSFSQWANEGHVPQTVDVVQLAEDRR